MGRLEDFRKFCQDWDVTHVAEFRFIVEVLEGVADIPTGVQFSNDMPSIDKDQFTGEEVLTICYTDSETGLEFLCIPSEVLNLLPDDIHLWNSDIIDEIREVYFEYQDRHHKAFVEDQKKRASKFSKEIETREKETLLRLINKYGIPKEAIAPSGAQ